MATAPTTPATAAAVLGVPLDAPAEQVRQAFRRLARHHHPDRGGDAASFRRVLAARDTLLAAHGADQARARATTSPQAGTPVRVVNAYRRPWGPTTTTGRWADVAA